MDDPFYYMLLEFAVVLSNTLIQGVVATGMWSLWRPKWATRIVIPYATLTAACFVAFTLKHALGMRHGNAPPLSCCMGYVLTLDYTMPSMHAMGAVLLAIYASQPYWAIVRPPQLEANGHSDEEAQLSLPAAVSSSGEGERDARIRLLIIWFYVLALCYARIMLRLNSLWDVGAGVALAVGAYFAQCHVARLLCPPPGAPEKTD